MPYSMYITDLPFGTVDALANAELLESSAIISRKT